MEKKPKRIDEQEQRFSASVDNAKNFLNYREKRFYNFGKRFFDICFSFLGILLALWLMAIIAILIKFQDMGPIFYNHYRVGKNGKFFKMYKFRTMIVGADKLKKTLVGSNETNGKTFKMKNDPRITRFGRFLRKTSLDELPQLFNVFNGTMSFVGPRPALPMEVENYTRVEEWNRLSVKQGITCIWQTSGRSNVPYENQIVMDNEYVSKRGLFFDFVLLIKTIPAVLGRKGAE